MFCEEIKKAYFCTENQSENHYEITMSYDVRCVANALIKMAYEDESREQMTNMKLQKLLYYEQAYHLARFGTPLFDDDIEA